MSREEELARARAEAELFAFLDFEPAEGWLCDARKDPCSNTPVWRIVHLCCGWTYPCCERHRLTAMYETRETATHCIHCGGSTLIEPKPLKGKV